MSGNPAAVDAPTVLLVDDQVATRAGVRRALEAAGLLVVGEAANAADAVDAALRHRPSVCLMSVPVPGGGITAAEQITAALPETKIVMLTESNRDEDLFAAIRAGAVGYLPKAMSAERLPHALRGVARGEAALPRGMTVRVLEELRDAGRRRRVQVGDREAIWIELTPREFEVLQLLRMRHGTGEIAAELQIAEVTVRRHISGLLRKLQVPDRRAAVELLDQGEQLRFQRLHPTAHGDAE